MSHRFTLREIRDVLRKASIALQAGHHFAMSPTSYSELERQHVIDMTKEARDQASLMSHELYADAEKVVLDRLDRNKAYRDREDRLAKNGLYATFLLPGPAQYIDSITDDIRCEEQLRDLGWSDARIEALMKNRYGPR